MFGYIKPYMPELKMREYELYRALYCGLCRSMGRATGQTSRLSLNYDFVFLAIVRMLLEGTTPEVSKKRCVAHPVKPRTFVHDCRELSYSARAAAYLTGGKIEDDIADERGLKRLRALSLRPAVRHALAKARRSSAEHELAIEGFVADKLSVLSELEADATPSLDSCAEAFGELLAELFALGLEEKKARIAREVGRGIGRFIYVCDAADDFADDVKKGRFNPIYALYGKGAAEEKDGGLVLSSDVAESVRTAALLDLERCALSVELLADEGNPELASIIRNIVYLGMPETLKNILNSESLTNG